MMELFTEIRDADGDQVTVGRYPVVNVNDAWELYSTLGLTLPGIEHHYEQADEAHARRGCCTPDWSWARATGSPRHHQPRRDHRLPTRTLDGHDYDRGRNWVTVMRGPAAKRASVAGHGRAASSAWARTSAALIHPFKTDEFHVPAPRSLVQQTPRKTGPAKQ